MLCPSVGVYCALDVVSVGGCLLRAAGEKLDEFLDAIDFDRDGKITFSEYMEYLLGPWCVELTKEEILRQLEVTLNDAVDLGIMQQTQANTVLTNAREGRADPGKMLKMWQKRVEDGK